VRWQYHQLPNISTALKKCSYQSLTTKHQALRSRWKSSRGSSRKLPYTWLPIHLEPLAASVHQLNSNNSWDLTNSQLPWFLAGFLQQQPLLPKPKNAEQLSLSFEYCPGQNTRRWTMGMHQEKKISVPTETGVRCVESIGKNLRFQFGGDRQLACR